MKIFSAGLALTLIAPVTASAVSLDRMERNTASKEARVAERMEKKKEVKESIEENREEAKAKFETRRTAFQAKLATIKDTKKRLAADRINTNLSKINEKRTDKMVEALTRLNEYLTKLENKTASYNEDLNTASADAALVLAQGALTKAETAIATQAGKEYIATITDEATLGKTVSATFKSLQTDLQATYKTIADAKAALVKAAREVKKLGTTTEPTEADSQ